MTVVETSLFSVLRKFPGRRDRIMRLFREREEFRTICEDYEKCLMSLRHWSASKTEEAPERREEYSDLASDLESEISKNLEEEE
jgi:hypothetical protein